MALMKTIKNLDTGIKYMLKASFIFANIVAYAKLSNDHMSSLQLVFFRNIAGVILVGFAIWQRHSLS